jgi:mono/diheme cytochrome c family protein
MRERYSTDRSHFHGRSVARLWPVPFLALLLAVGVALCLPLAGQSNSAGPAHTLTTRTVALPNSPPTPVTGLSWLHRVGPFLSDTAMGKTGAYGPSPHNQANSTPAVSSSAEITDPALPRGTIAVTGADLYRFECQGCHRTDGRGMPPEINSMINPVRATSPQLIRKHMEEVGAPMSSRAARELANQSQTALVNRIEHGGVRMPGFSNLNPVEIEALVAYINQLAGVPGAEKWQLRLNEPSVRVGEHLVKATCHICHDAAGPKPTPEQMMQGAIPPLSTLPRSKSLQEFVQKVTAGAPATMGVLELPYRGRMPVFYYIRPDEAAAAYFYFSMYPPEAGPPITAQTAPAGNPPKRRSAGVVK